MTLSVSISAQTAEICNNGRDDDGDGLIDCFDPDCRGIGNCSEFFFGQAVADCGFTPEPLADFQLNLLFRTDEVRFPIDQRAGVFIGDMNGDGVPDLVSRDNGPPRLQIFSGDDGRILQSIVTPATHPFGQTALADVDANGRGDIFQIETGGRLARYEFGNPDAVWRTANDIGDDNDVSTAQIADINQDGRPEVYVGNRIFDALTGNRLVAGGSNINVGGYSGGSNSDRFPLYFDLFQPGDPKPGGGTFGPEANGLEYIAGNQVWTVTFTSNVANSGSFQLAVELPGPSNEQDGLTSIADINGDGLLDIAVMDAGRVYAWDPYTNQQIGAGFDVPNTNSGGRINIGDFDGDGNVELGFAGRDIYIVRDYSGENGNNNGTWSTLWQKTDLDDGSQRTGSTLFDFDGDGIVEVVYSEEEDLFIYAGPDGRELFRTTSRAGTRTEYPLVADVNGDGQAEIIVTAQERNGPAFSGDGWISVYGSANQPWVPARKVWNQHGYNVVNINNDLTVPQFQQNPLNMIFGGRYNNFLVQTSVGGDSITNRFPAPDAVISVQMINNQRVIDFSGCPDFIRPTLMIDNFGSAPLPASTPISYYVGNPRLTAARLIQTTTIGVQVDTMASVLVQVNIPVGSVTPGSMIFLSVNDPGFAMADLPFDEDDFPLTGTAECDYTNNVNFIGNVRCGEVCDDGTDNDGDGLTDEPNLFAPETTGCPGQTLQPITADVSTGTFSVISSTGTTVTPGGVVTLGSNLTGLADVDTIIFDDGICLDTVFVTSIDDINPVIDCPGNQTVNADADCTALSIEYTGMSQVSDNCPTSGAVTQVQSPPVGAALSLGPNPVTITATDPSGNQSSCTFTVTVRDRMDPVITSCPPATDIVADSGCNATIPDLTGAVTATDNCTMVGNFTITQTPAGTTLNGTGTSRQVMITVADEAGNTTNCMFSVTVVDETAPAIQCPGNVTRDLSADDCTLSVPDFRGQAGRQDNCARFDQLTVTQAPAPGSLITTPGNTPVTLTVTDPGGNAASCTFTLTAVDRQRPALSCPGNVTVDADPMLCAGTVTDITGLVTTSDNCGATGLVVTQNPAAGTTFTASTQNVTVVATDAGGNSSQCTVTFVKRDVTPPTANCPADQRLVVNDNCLAILPNYMMGAGSDACGGVSIVQTPGPGTNLSNDVTVTLRVTDNEEQVSSCDFNVVVEDETPPTITCPQPQVLAVNGNCTAPLPDYTSQAAVTDNCDPRKGPVTVAQSPAPGTPVSGNGTVINVTLTATDASGNVADCTFPVTLEDMQEPSITCPVSPQVESVNADCQTSLPDFRDQTTVTSMCTSEGITLTQSPVPGTVVTGLQTVPVTITATDEAGNQVSCTFDYRTIDNTDPVIECPADQSAILDADCEFDLADYTSLATASDNCTINPTVTQDPLPPLTVDGDGTVTQIMLTATDDSGNTGSCSFTLTVTDETPPTLECPAPQSATVGNDCTFSLPDYTGLVTAPDNCSDPAAVLLTQSPAAMTIVSGAGTVTTVLITATDAAGNESDCSFTLTITDVTAPEINCPPATTLTVDDACTAIVPNLITATTATDNCSAATGILLSQDIAAGTSLTGDGTSRLVTLTATDESSNSASCTVLVMLDDVTPPTLVCPAAQDVVLAADCSVALPDFGGQLTLDDNCVAAADLLIMQMPPAGSPVSGANTVVSVRFDVDDDNGNMANCTFDVTLRDRTPPTITCPVPALLPLDSDCRAVLPDYTGLATVADACEASQTATLTVTQLPAAGNQLSFAGDSRTVTLTVRDGNGNSANCSFPVTATDLTAPAIVCPADREVEVDGSCVYEVPDFAAESGVTDNCSEVTAITITQDVPVGSSLGGLNVARTVTLTAEDAAGNTTDCSFELTPVDVTAPAITCPAPQTIYLDAANCQAALGDYTADAEASDNCSAPALVAQSILQTPVPGTLFSGLLPSDTTIVLSVTDESGNVDTCRFTVLIRDTVAPLISCPLPTIVVLDENCNGEMPALMTVDSSDNCSTGTLTLFQTPEPGTEFGGDGTSSTVTLTVRDPSGNEASCQTMVTFEDRTPPIPTECPADQVYDVNSDCPVPLPDYRSSVTVADNCRAAADILLIQDPAPGTLVSGNGTVIDITITSDDGNGNTNTCDFSVTLEDNTGVQLTCPGGQLVIASSDNCDAPLPDYTGLVVTSDDCQVFPANGTITQVPAPGTLLQPEQLNDPLAVIMIVNDGNDNITRCTLTATLIDTLAPAIVCPPAQTVPVLEGSCQALVPEFADLAVIFDNCSPPDAITLTQSPPATSVIFGPDARQTVTLTVTDADGNRSSCDFQLIVVDTLVPLVSCPAPDTLLLDGSCRAVLGDYRSATLSSDNCTDANDITVEQQPPPGTILSGQLTTELVTVTATDGSGNSASCVFPVTLVDRLPPMIFCPGDQVVRPDANCQALVGDYRNIARVTDNCAPAGSITITQTPAVGTPLTGQNAATEVLLVATDGNGNFESCTITVRLLDNVAPRIVCPDNETIGLDDDCDYALTDFTANAAVLDNCTAMNEIIVTQDPGTGATFSGDGTTIVLTLTADDRNGNTAQCQTTITLNDAIPPTIGCPEPDTLFVDAGCTARVPDYRAVAPVSDNCTADGDIVITQSPAAGTLLSGDNTTRTITLTADDGNGNTTDCSFPLRLEDETPPTISCPVRQNVFVDGDCLTTLPDYTGLATVSDNCAEATAITVTQGAAAGAELTGLSTETVTLTANDGNGNTADCSFSVSVLDNTPPVLLCPTTSTLAADASCTVTIPNYLDSITVGDNCGPLSVQGGTISLVQSPLPGSTFSELGEVETVTLTATDPSGNQSICTVAVALADTIRPTISCPNDTTLAVDANCAAVVPDYTRLPVVDDNCSEQSGLAVTQRPAAGTPVSDEATELAVTLRVTDESGNVDSCQFTVQLIDTLSPVVVCPPNDTISIDGNCEVLLADYTPNARPTDNCSDPNAIVLTQRPPPGTPLSGDGTSLEITILATDESGNTDSCQFLVVLEDRTEPTINCPADQELTADGSCSALLPDYTGEAVTSSECDQGGAITVTQSPAPGTPITGNGTTETVTLTATDASGNSTSCDFTVELVDRTPPTIVNCQTDTVGLLTLACEYELPDYWSLVPAANGTSAQDACTPTGTTATTATGNQITYTQLPAPGTVLEGAFTIREVTLTADDNNGNRSSCSFLLTLRDNTPPTINCPADTVANPDAGCDFTLEDYTTRAAVADNCSDLTITQTPAPGTVISGDATTQTITLTVQDPSGNTTSCDFELLLRDTTPPSITCPADKVELLDAACAFAVPDYTGAALTGDNCTEGSGIAVTQVPGVGEVFSEEGTSFSVTLTADDGNGNASDCNFTVTLDDRLAPVLNCPADSTVFLDGNCMAPLPDLVAVTSATDNCEAFSSVSIAQSPLAGVAFRDDDTTVPVTLTANDGNGNTAQCVVTVTFQDTTRPVVVCPPAEVLLTDGDCEVRIPDFTVATAATDNCTANGAISITQDVMAGSVLSGEGTTETITLTADDGNGNTATCTVTVSVDDVTPPTIVCPPTQAQFTDGSCQVVVADYTGLAVTEDNCSGAGAAISVTQEPRAGTVLTNVQNQTVTLTADDGNGNVASCDFLLRVRDNVAPTINCPTTRTEVADGDCVATLQDYTALATTSDNCPTDLTAITVTQNPLPATIAGFDRELTVTLTATDSSGNFSTCQFRVELVDETPPSISCPGSQTQFVDADCATQLEDYRLLATATDNCDDAATALIYEQSPAAGLPLTGDGNEREVSITATDRSGNTASCSFTVTLRDATPPTIVCPGRDTLPVDGNCLIELPDYTSTGAVTDNCSVESTINVTQSPLPGTAFSNDPPNPNTLIDVTLLADDGNGNTSPCTFQVELVDMQEPVISCPGRQLLFADENCTQTIPDYRDLAEVTTECNVLSTFTFVQENENGLPTISGDSTVRTVMITATDGSGNSASCSFDVILLDTVAPMITVCPPDRIRYLDANCDATLPDLRPELVATDNCEFPIAFRVSQTPAPATVVSQDGSEIVVTLTVDDSNGNLTDCQATITLRDTISPTIVCPLPDTIFTNASCQASLPDYTGATTADNCTSETAIAVTQLPAAGDLLNGFNDQRTVILTADDGNGNTVSCAFTVTLGDDDPPTINCPIRQTIGVANDCNFELADYRSLSDATDNCAADLLIIEQLPGPGTLVPDLNTVTDVTLTVTDAGGNTANCVFTVLNRSDTPPPPARTVILAVVAPPTGTGTVDLLDAFDPQAESNLSNSDLDGGLNAGSAPFLVSFYGNLEDANAEENGFEPENYDPVANGETVAVRIEDPATGCFVVSQVLFDQRTPGTSTAVMQVTVCNRAPFRTEIDGRPQPGGMGTTIIRHEWRIVEAGPTGITPANLLTPGAQVLTIGTEGLRSGDFVLEYQFFEDYGDGPLVPSVPKRVTVTLNNVDCGGFFWDGR